MRSIRRIFAGMAAFAAVSLIGAPAFGQAVQVLDSVDVFGRNTAGSTVLEMGFRDPLPRVDAQALNVAGTAILACQRAADQGLYCLDGAIVRQWPDTRQVPYGDPVPDLQLFSCADRALGFDSRKPNPCTSITVDLPGTLWVAGRKGNSHSLVKVVQKSPGLACDASNSVATGWVELARIDAAAPLYCAREWAPGRPVLVDISSIDGELVEGFIGLPAILGVEERKTVVLFPDESTSSGGPARLPIEFASGKSGWSLIGNEQLLGASLLQFGDPAVNYVLVTTTLGRVLAKKAATTGVGEGLAFPVFAFDSCSVAGEQNYSIRVSSQSERVYVADKSCGKVSALKWITSGAYPGYCAANSAFCLVNAQEKGSDGSPQPVTLSTGSTSADGLSIAPGIGIDLRDCGFDANGAPKACPLIGDGNANNYNAAELKGVRLVDASNNGMTVFQVKGIPDCRWWPTHPECAGSGVGPGDFLDVAPLLPEEVVTQVMKALQTSQLPALLISPEYRGQDSNRPRKQAGDEGYAPTIDLFFGITEPGVQFRDTFSASFDIADLTGSEWGCGKGEQVVLGANGVPTAPDVEWDVVTTVSEKHATVGGSAGIVTGPGKEHVDMLVNTGCINPTQISGGRWSLYAYSLEVVPNGDSVYAILMRSLYQDLHDAQNLTACEPVDGQATPAIASCDDLNTSWEAAFDKLDRCIVSSTYPRQSAAVNNCQSFLSQLGQYQSTLDGIPVVPANDPANRIGELKVRASVVRYVFENHFIPSIPPDGFRCDTTSTGDCAQ